MKLTWHENFEFFKWPGFILLFFFLVFSLLLIEGSCRAESGDAGQLGQLFDLGTGVHVEGMGQAATALGEDISTVFWNPAAIPRVSYSGINASYQKLFLNTQHSSLSAIFNENQNFGFGVGYIRLGSGGFQGYDASGNPTGSFDVIEQALMVSGGYRLSSDFSIGISGKYFNQKIASISRGSPGFDASLHYQPFSVWQVGLNVMNIVKPSIGPDEFPLIYRAGTALRLWDDRIRLAIDGEFQKQRDPIMHYGLEFVDQRDWPFERELSLRAGVNDDRFTLGASVTIDENFKIDYSLVDHEIDMLNQFAFNYRWGMPEEKEKDSQEIFQGIEEQLPGLPEIGLDTTPHTYFDTGSDYRLQPGEVSSEPIFHLEFVGMSDVFNPVGPTFSVPTVRTSSFGEEILPKTEFQWQDSSNENSQSTELSRLQERIRKNLNAGNLDRARKLLRKARRIAPEDLQNQKLRQKLENATATDDIRASQAREAYQNGLVAFSEGNYQEAIDYWRRTLRLDSDHQKAKNAIERTKLLLENE